MQIFSWTNDWPETQKLAFEHYEARVRCCRLCTRTHPHAVTAGDPVCTTAYRFTRFVLLLTALGNSARCALCRRR